MKSYDTIVIGAGMSGLAAASEICKVNQSVIVLEGRDRIGGRLATEKLADGLIIEKGGGLIHGTNNLMYTRIKELGIEIQELKKEEDNVSLIETIQLLFVVFLLRLGLHPKPKIDESVDEYVNRLPFFPKSLNKFLDLASLDIETFDKVSALFFIGQMRQMILEGEMYLDRDFLIKGGYITFLQHLAKDLPIAFNHAVTRIIWQDDQIVVETNQGSYSAQKVVLTVPIPLLKKIAFKPELPQEKKVAISAFASSDILKIVIPVQKKAFKTDIEEGLIKDAKFVPVWWRRNLDGDAPEDRQVLVGWTTGPYARHYLSQPADEALSMALEELTEVINIDLVDREDVRVQNWMDEEFSLGTYSYVKPGYNENVVADLAKPIADKLYFAGTGTSKGGAHGAYESGLRVAKEILEV